MPSKKLKGKDGFRSDDLGDRQFEALRPSFANVPFVRALLAQGKECVDVWPEQIALALGLSDHYVSLRSSLLVDQHFTYLAFAVRNHFSPEKTLAFIEEQEHLRAAILADADPDVDAVAAGFKAAMLARIKAPAPPQPLAGEVEAEDDPERGRISPRERKKSKAKLKEEFRDAAMRPPKKELPVEPVVYSVADVTSILEFTLSGILQHHHLYRYAYRTETARAVVSAGTVGPHVETAAPPPPLQRAAREQDFVEAAALQKVQEDEEERLRLKEYEERAEAERHAAQLRRAEEEARALKEKERAA
eukprot:EG_transcript_20367